MKTISYSSESFPAQVASGGIAMGKALIIGKKAFLEKNYDSSDPSIFLASIQETKFQLKDLASTKSQIEGDILEFQLSLLDDSDATSSSSTAVLPVSTFISLSFEN